MSSMARKFREKKELQQQLQFRRSEEKFFNSMNQKIQQQLNHLQIQEMQLRTMLRCQEEKKRVTFMAGPSSSKPKTGHEKLNLKVSTSTDHDKEEEEEEEEDDDYDDIESQDSTNEDDDEEMSEEDANEYFEGYEVYESPLSMYSKNTSGQFQNAGSSQVLYPTTDTDMESDNAAFEQEFKL